MFSNLYSNKKAPLKGLPTIFANDLFSTFSFSFEFLTEFNENKKTIFFA